MGLESINFLFKSESDLKDTLLFFEHIHSLDDREYFYKEENKFCIDLLLQDQFRLSIRIALCNPMEEVLNAFFLLLNQLFKHGGLLLNLNSKKEFININEFTQSEIRQIYKERKKNLKFIMEILRWLLVSNLFMKKRKKNDRIRNSRKITFF